MPETGFLTQYNENAGAPLRMWVIDAEGNQTIQEVSSVMSAGASIFATVYYVDPTDGSDTNDGLAPSSAFATVQKAVDVIAGAGTTGNAIIVAEGFHDQQVSIPRVVGNLTIIGAGGRGATGLELSEAGEVALTFNNDGLTLVNFGVASEDSAAYAVRGTGSRFRAVGCKFEGVDTSGAALGIGPGSDAAITAGTAGAGSDAIITDCEFAWSYNGVALVASDYGVPTEIFINGGKFHNISNKHIVGVPGAFGIGSTRTFECKGASFLTDEEGTAPAKYIELDHADDSGMFADNYFAIATNAAAKLDIGAKILWVANKTEAGSSTARPA